MLTAIKTDLIEHERIIDKKLTPICLNAFREVMLTTVETYKNLSLHCTFDDLIAASIFYLEKCAGYDPGLVLSKQMILSAANEMRTSCRRCLSNILFEEKSHDLEYEASESGIRLSALQVINIIYELGLDKENLLLEKSQAEMEHNLESLKSQLTIEFNRIIENSITSIRFIDKRNPALCLLVKNQGYIGYLIGAVARITKKEAIDCYFLSNVS